MTDTPIEPALNAAQWKALKRDEEFSLDETAAFGKYVGIRYAHTADASGRGLILTEPSDNSVGIFMPRNVAALIAAANDALPGSDPRKITREHIRACRRQLNDWVEDRDEILRHLAAALESYLPPE